MAYGLREASIATGMAKVTVWKAIQAGKISATRDPHGQWKIEPAELHRLYPPVTREPDEAIVNVNGNALLTLEIRYLKEKLADTERMLSAQVEDLKSERDRLLRVVEEQSGSLKALSDQRQSSAPALSPEAPPPPPAPPPRRWFGGWRRS